MNQFGTLGDDHLYVRFDPGFGLNVYIGRVNAGHAKQEFGMSIQGWERLCGLVDEWRARELSKEGE